MHAEKICKIKKIGIHPTVDIEVDNTSHTFYANNIVGQNSHGVSYGYLTYLTCYLKCHAPHLFFLSYLSSSENKSKWKEETNLLVNDAKSFGMTFLGPSILESEDNFSIFGKTIRFGLGNISKVGESRLVELRNAISIAEQTLSKNISEFSWFDILSHIFPKVNSEVMKNLISVGAFSHLPMYRKQMLFEVAKFEMLTEREIGFSMGKADTLLKALEYLLAGGFKISEQRLAKIREACKTLRNPPNDLIDSEDWICNAEKELLGVEITCSKLDHIDKSMGDCKCSLLKEMEDGQYYNIVGVISSVSEYLPKQGKCQGKKMAYISLSDETGSCKNIAFPDTYTKYENILFDGNTVCIFGKKKDDGLTINKVTQL
jgi:DNA polymerase-3 subunit alpha